MTDRFYSKPCINCTLDILVSYIKRENRHKFHFLFGSFDRIFDSEGVIPTWTVYPDYSGYYLEKINAYDKAQKENKRYFVCHNSAGHFMIVDSENSSIEENVWRTFNVPKRETAYELCEEMNNLITEKCGEV